MFSFVLLAPQLGARVGQAQGGRGNLLRFCPGLGIPCVEITREAYDRDANQTPILVDGDYQGQPRKLLAMASRSGYYFLSDRATGESLMRTKKPATWKTTKAAVRPASGARDAARARLPDRQSPRPAPAVHGPQNGPPAGGLLFTNESGHLVALDAASGKVLWHVNPGGNLTGSPMLYEIDGRQFVLTPVDGVLYAWTLPT